MTPNVELPTLVDTVYKGFLTVKTWLMPGVSFQHEVVTTTDSVAGLLYDRSNHRVLLVQQARAAMVRVDNPTGTIIELVAGRIDVNLGPAQLLVKEAKEEAGVALSPNDVKILNGGEPLALSAGVLTERAYLAFATIYPDQVEKGDDGRGLREEGENITRVWIDADEFVRGAHEDLRCAYMALWLGNYFNNR